MMMLVGIVGKPSIDVGRGTYSNTIRRVVVYNTSK